MVAENFERWDEGPSVRMELAGSHVHLGKEILLEEGEGKSEVQPLENSRIDEGEAHTQVSVILPVKSARGLVCIAAQQGSEMVGGEFDRRLGEQVEGSPLVHPRVVVVRRVRTR